MLLSLFLLVYSVHSVLGEILDLVRVFIATLRFEVVFWGGGREALSPVAECGVVVFSVMLFFRALICTALFVCFVGVPMCGF